MTAASKRIACRQATLPACLPAEFLERAVTHLAWLATINAVAGPALQILQRLFQPDLYFAERQAVLLVAGPTFFLASAVVAFLAHQRRLPAATLLDLGLLYQVTGAFCLSLIENSYPWPPDAPVRGISWAPFWVVCYILVVPNVPWKSLTAALACGLMWPLGLALCVALGLTAWPAPDRLAILMFPNLVAALLAYVMARLMYRLGAAATRAQEMGSYTLVERIGAGGMGEVWRAEHQMLRRHAAIKLIRPEALTQDTGRASLMLRRFEREAQATAQLHSPHTIAIFDYGISDEGVFYYVMELLHGLDFESLVERYGPQPPARVVSFLRQACDSLAEAHARGLIHRDIKPRNLFTCRLGFQYDFVKVLDFGLVKHELGFGETQTRLTLEGVTTGTPAYMPPEMATSAPVDHRADLYSLGCVAYWLLTGQLVFERDSTMAMVLAHVQTPPDPPSRWLDDPVPGALERIILSCLEKDPGRRPQSARELNALLADCEAGEWTPSDAERWWQRHLPSAEEARRVVEAAARTV